MKLNTPFAGEVDQLVVVESYINVLKNETVHRVLKDPEYFNVVSPIGVIGFFYIVEGGRWWFDLQNEFVGSQYVLVGKICILGLGGNGVQVVMLGLYQRADGRFFGCADFK